MRKISLLLALLLAACGRKHPGPASPAPLTIAITHDGFVKLDGKAVTLDELGAQLAARREAVPLEDLSWGAKATPLTVRLDLDDETLWSHVGWVMTILEEQRFWRLSLPGGRASPLPVDANIEGDSPPDGKALLARVLVLEDGQYVLGDRATRDALEIGKWIDAAPRHGIARRIGRIGGQSDVTWRLIRPVFDTLRGKGFERIDLPTSYPVGSMRGMSPLPGPKAWTLPRNWSWLRVVDYWSILDAYEGEFDCDLPVSVDEELLALLDAHRRGLALSDFAPDHMLSEAATAHAKEMNRLGYFGHFSPVPGNRSPSDRLVRSGWPVGRRFSELLANAGTAEAAFDAILAKPENAAVLADPAYKRVGAARSGDCWVVLLGAEP